MMISFFRRFSVAKISYPQTSRINESDKLDRSCISKFKNVDRNSFKVFHSPFLHRDHNRILDLFGDHSYMIRKQFIEAVEIVEDIEKIQRQMTNKIVPKILFHGEPGCGISTILSSLNEHLSSKNHLVFSFSWMEGYLKRVGDLSLSNEIHHEKNPHISGEIFDFPERSAAWLKSFVEMNKKILERENPVLSTDVVWSAKENSPRGSSWLEMIEFCSTRIKFSTDCIGILLREARYFSSKSESAPPFSLVLDGINAMWCRGTILKDTKGNKLGVDRIALFMHLKRALKADWSKGIIIAAPNQRAAWFTDREAFDPGYMLTKPGFEAMNPFIPIKVENMTDEEFNQMLRFYSENKWLSRDVSYTDTGRKEIEALSEKNFKELFKVVSEY